MDEITVMNLLEGITILKHDMTEVEQLAKQRPGYWLTLVGVCAMFGRAINAWYQLFSNEPMDSSGWYLVACATGKLLGDIGSLTVLTGVVRAEMKL